MELLPTGSLGGEDGGGDKSNPASPDDMPGGSNGKVYAKNFYKIQSRLDINFMSTEVLFQKLVTMLMYL